MQAAHMGNGHLARTETVNTDVSGNFYQLFLHLLFDGSCLDGDFISAFQPFRAGCFNLHGSVQSR